MNVISALAALALLATPAAPRARGPVPQPQVAVLPPYDALAAYPGRAPVSDRLKDPSLVRLSAPLEMDARFGVPTFVFAAPSQEAITPRQAGATAEGAARGHLARFAPLYGVSAAQLANARVLGVHDTGQGAIIVRFGQQLGGTPIFREELAVTMDRELRAVALSGFFTALPAVASGAHLQAADAVGSALAASAHPGVEAAQLQAVPSAIRGEQHFDALPASGLHFTRPARVRPVYYHLPDRLEPAYYVELFVENPEQTGNEAYALVVSARDGKPLMRHSLIAYDYNYRVFASDDAADGGLQMPFDDGPYGNGLDPHPTGNVFTSLSNTPFTTPNLITLNHGPTLLNDPWLGLGATETVGNNADAYIDLAAPDGYSPNTGDFRADTTSLGTFDRTYDTTQRAESSHDQQKASITQLFYQVNWLHDWYYGAGFDEAAGNAQKSNYGRGGIENDPLLAEAQDYSGRNNSNMETPSDGYSPRMQMYVFDGASPTTLQVTAPSSVAGSYAVAGSAFGPQTYHLTGAVAALSGANQNGCTAYSTTEKALVNGKVALIDRGTCSFQQKAVNAAAGGAIALIVVQNRTDPPFEMSGDGTAVAIPGQMIGQADGQTLRVASGLQVTLDRSQGLDRDGTIDTQISGHEWGHYISNRLIHDGNGLNSNMAGGMGEGWADFHAMLLTVRPEQAAMLQNVEWSGVFPLAVYTSAGSDPAFGYYYGIRRVPYSTDLSKNPLTFQHIQEGTALPAGVPVAFGQDGVGNSEVHNTGEVWCTMLWEAYAALLRQTPERLSFDEARDRMRAYLVAAYKITPVDPTFLEARDALLAVAYANDLSDFTAFQKAFAKRGAGLHAISPDHYSSDNVGVVEDYSWGNDLAIVSATLTDDGVSCDHDGVLDVGETGTLTVVLKNIGGAPLTHTTAHVTSADGSATITGATVAVPETDPYGPTQTVQLPVTLSGVTGIAALNLAVTVSDPDITSYGVSQLPVSVEGNYDLSPASSKVDTVESPNVVWTMTAETGNVNVPGQGEMPLDGAAGWKRIAAGPTDHRLFGVDDNQPSLLHLTSPALQVGPTALTVHAKARWSFEVDSQDPTVSYDGAVVEVSTDNGATWKDVGAQATPGYGGALYDQSGNPLSGKHAFVGTNPSWPDFDELVIDLGKDYAGQTVKLRFSVGSDAAAAAYGMELDDIAFSGITNAPFDAVVPDRHICEANPPVGKLSAPSVVTSGKSYTLDASASTSPSGAALTYAWTQLAGPSIDLSDATAKVAGFTAPDVTAPTLATFQLVVNDGTSNGYPVVTTFTILPAPAKPAFSHSFTAPTSGGGCGAAGGGLELFALGALALLRRRKK